MARASLLLVTVLLAGCSPQAVPAWTFSWHDPDWTEAAVQQPGVRESDMRDAPEALPWPPGHPAIGSGLVSITWTHGAWSGTLDLHRLHVTGPEGQDNAAREEARAMLLPLMAGEAVNASLDAFVPVVLGCSPGPCQSNHGGWMADLQGFVQVPGSWLQEGAFAPPKLPQEPWDRFVGHAGWEVEAGPTLELALPVYVGGPDVPGVHSAWLEFDAFGAATFTVAQRGLHEEDARSAMVEALADWPPLPDEVVAIRTSVG